MWERLLVPQSFIPTRSDLDFLFWRVNLPMGLPPRSLNSNSLVWLRALQRHFVVLDHDLCKEETR